MKVKNLNNLVIITFVALYFLSPVDLVPDFIPGIGHLDEILIGLLMWSLLDKEIETDDETEEEND